MRIWEVTEDIKNRQECLEEKGYNAYCLATKSGWECDLADHLNLLNGEILALPFMKVSHVSRNGKKSVTQKVLLPSYVFLFCPRDYKTEDLDRAFREGFHFVYSEESKDKTLQKTDLLYAKWVFSSSGIIGMSKAIRSGSRVKIIDGPLLALEGTIKEYSKKNRNCRVETVLFNRVINVWLPFTYVEKLPESTESTSSSK